MPKYGMECKKSPQPAEKISTKVKVNTTENNELLNKLKALASVSSSHPDKSTRLHQYPLSQSPIQKHQYKQVTNRTHRTEIVTMEKRLVQRLAEIDRNEEQGSSIQSDMLDKRMKATSKCFDELLSKGVIEKDAVHLLKILKCGYEEY